MLVFGSKFYPTKKPQILPFSAAALAQKAQFVAVSSPEEAIFANLNGVKFAVCEGVEFAAQLQKLADDYLFDARILLLISGRESGENGGENGAAAQFGAAIARRIDGVIFADGEFLGED